jgi:3-oxoadipate enol-lactonase
MPTVHVNDIDVHYELQGEGQPLLFIHGLGSSTRDWESQVPIFARAYRVITFDLRGHGQSGKPPGPYSMQMFAADTIALARALGVDQAHVVGVSLGGGIAMQIALDAPRLVRTLTVVNSAPELLVHSLRDRFLMWQRFVVVRWMGMRKMGQVLADRLFVQSGDEPLKATFVSRWAENDPRAYLAALRAMVGWSITGRLGAIQCPTLVLTAEHDYTPVSLKEKYSRLIPNARLVVVPDSRHALPIERPHEFNRALEAFLESAVVAEASATP